MRTPRPLPPLPPHFTTTDAAAAGVTPRRLRATDLNGQLHGLRKVGPTEPTLEERCRMLSLRAPAHAFFSHATAALLWGAPLPWSLETERRIHVSVPAPAARLHSRDVFGHQLAISADEVTQWGGLALTSPARTWCDLAAHLELGDLVAVGDYFIHRRAPLADRVDLARAVGRAGRQRGVQLAREAVMLLSDAAESRPESRLRVLLARADVPPVEVNHTLVDSQSGRQVRPDFLFRGVRVILEYQGDYHRTRQQWRRDMTRRSRLEAQGWQVMELNADDLLDPTELVARIRALIRRQPPSVPTLSE